MLCWLFWSIIMLVESTVLKILAVFSGSFLLDIVKPNEQ